ncbi:protein NO VEIN domain-containing protein [Myroides sp. LJL116]
MVLEDCGHNKELQTSFLEELHHSQAGGGRHRCVTCAYHLGYDLGCSGIYKDYDSFLSLFSNEEKEHCKDKKSLVPTKLLSALEFNQAGSGRHKCCNCAFVAGFEEGLYLKKQINAAVWQSKEFFLKEGNAPVYRSLVSPSNDSFKENSNVVKDFDYIEQNNFLRIIGEIGEEIVLNYLQQLGKKVKHSSKEVGDGLGYDILAYDSHGEKMFIEVKTTVKDQRSPFYLSSSEHSFLNNNSNTFIYRVYNLDIDKKTADFFILDQQEIKKLSYTVSVYKVHI